MVFSSSSTACRYKAIVPFTTDTEVVNSGISGLTLGNGGDIPEAVYSGLIGILLSSRALICLFSFTYILLTFLLMTITGALTANGLGMWRQNSRKTIILMGDAPALAPEPETGL
jgi:hypothetical protein